MISKQSGSCWYSETDRYLEVAAVAPPEGQDETPKDQFSNLWELGVDNGDDSGINVSEDGRRCLSLEHGASQQTPDRQDERTAKIIRT